MKQPFTIDSTIISATAVVIIVAFVVVPIVKQLVAKDLRHHHCY